MKGSPRLGKRFGRLVVLKQAVRKNYLTCQCDCGTVKDICSSNLKTRGGVQSCGCLLKEQFSIWMNEYRGETPLHMPQAKFCRKCLGMKDRDEFGIDKYRPDGKNTYCLGCKREYGDAYDLEHREEKFAKVTTKRIARRTDLCVDGINKNDVSSEKQECTTCHKVKTLHEFRNNYRKKNGKTTQCRKCLQEYHVTHYQESGKTIRLRQRIRRVEHSEKVRANDRMYNERRRSRIAGAEKYDLSPEQFEEMCRIRKYRCAYCPDNCRACKNKTHVLHQEHVEPVMNGGSYTLQNILPSCAKCNRKKWMGPVLVPVQLEMITEASPRKPPRRRSKKNEAAAD